MIHGGKNLMKLRSANFTPLIFTIPAITIGAIAMYHNEIPTLIWAQNIFILVMAGFISFLNPSSSPFYHSNFAKSGECCHI